MAINEVRRSETANGAVTVLLTYDNDDGVLDPDIEAYRIIWDIPAGMSATANIYRNSNGSVWRTAELTGQGEWSDTAPFGPIKKVDDLRFEVVF